MERTCPTCKLKIEDGALQRCPRCYTIVSKPLKCGDCKGCSILKTCKK